MTFIVPAEYRGRRPEDDAADAAERRMKDNRARSLARDLLRHNGGRIRDLRN